LQGNHYFFYIHIYMETNTPSTTGLFELSIDSTAHGYLLDAARWAKFLAFVGFIFCVCFMTIALFVGTLSETFTTLGSQSFSLLFKTLITFAYAGLALLNFFPCLYLYKFASKMQVALRDNNQEQLNRSFKNMRSFYRFVGMLMIICLCFFALSLLGIILQARFMHAGTGTGI